MMLFASASLACTTPVCQYAIEVWPADDYEVTISYGTPLTPQQQALLNRIKASAKDADRPSNLRLTMRRVEAAATAAASAPTISVAYPRQPSEAAPIWRAPLDAASVTALLDSPARREIAKRLMGGDAAVWVLVESGDKAKDEASAGVLEAELPRLTKALERYIPGYFASPAGQDQTEGDQVFRPSFSMLRLSRSARQEQALLSMLLNSEPDLGEYAGQPMAFPVFGRGYVLYALVGRGINKDHVEEACAFITGPCACKLKADNPCTDLLIAANWEAAAPGFAVADEPPPELTGVFPEAAPQRPAAVPSGAPAPGGGIVRNTVIALGGVAALIALGAAVLRRRRRKTPAEADR